MTTVYLVTSGEYSDYSVDGVFSTEIWAEEFAAKAEDSRVEPWELDERVQDKICFYWTAILDLLTGTLDRGTNSSELADPKTRNDDVVWANYKCTTHPKGYISSRSFVSQEHANKLCVEKKQEIQRQKGD